MLRALRDRAGGDRAGNRLATSPQCPAKIWPTSGLRSSVQLKGALSTAANVQIWSDEPERICFHVLVGSESQHELAETCLDHLAAKAQLQFALSDVLRLYNSTDALWQKSSQPLRPQLASTPSSA
mmetsp:Transcript_28519/g.65574  ORF Transcript_28519/g.65574 Transcript_28519/m.65574 type:complete len:125 (-) Transcript_28519:931-1305(-)